MKILNLTLSWPILYGQIHQFTYLTTSLLAAKIAILSLITFATLFNILVSEHLEQRFCELNVDCFFCFACLNKPAGFFMARGHVI